MKILFFNVFIIKQYLVLLITNVCLVINVCIYHINYKKLTTVLKLILHSSGQVGSDQIIMFSYIYVHTT